MLCLSKTRVLGKNRRKLGFHVLPGDRSSIMVSNHSAVGGGGGSGFRGSEDPETSWREEGKKEAGSCSLEPVTSMRNALPVGYQFK